jgi:hypothetical protein
MLALGFGNWTFWDTYAVNDVFGNQAVTFDGPNKLILVNPSVTSLDFKEDVYSNWKEWQMDPHYQNSQYLFAMTAVGGNPLPGARTLGITYFLENGWRMRTWEGDHNLAINGNVYTVEGDDVFVNTIENWNIQITFNVSNLVDIVETGALLDINSVQELDDLHKLHGLDSDNPLVVDPTSRTAGTITQTIGEVTVGDDTTVTVTRTDSG